jgi:hypothetical protein
LAAPVVISPDVGKFNLFFSSTVILAINSATNLLFGFICNFFIALFWNSQKTLKVASSIYFFSFTRFF